MAVMINSTPEYYGESQVWNAFKNFLPANVIVYNNMEVYGREFDFCVLLPNKGLLIVEVKGWKPDQVDVESKDKIHISGYDDPVGSPKQQARSYRFALLDKIKKRYSISPLVFDMVCYPFINKEDYYKLSLNIVSEEEFTILKEDLNNYDSLNRKINQAFSSFSYVGFNDFNTDLVNKVRLLFEPETSITSKNESAPYSRVTYTISSMTETDISKIVDGYISGVKTLVFTNIKDNYTNLITQIHKRYTDLHIKNVGNNLLYGIPDAINVSSLGNEFKSFNFEAYLIDTSVYSGNFMLEDGVMDKEKEDILCALSKITSFNYEQFVIEHESNQKNILVQAGAGTGKTYSMISRIAFLCNKRGAHVSNIADEVAMMTFTNDAASNMKSRLKQMFMNYAILTGKEKYHSFIQDVDRANISTIHKFVISILQKLSLYTGLGVDLSISTDQHAREKFYDAYLEEFVVKKINEDSDFTKSLPVQLYNLKDVIMKMAKHLLTKSVDIEEIKNNELGTTNDFIPFFNDIITDVIIPAEKEYFQYMHSMNRMDLIECMILLNRILANNNTVSLNDYKIEYLFIDEFQDTDDVQIDLFEKLQKLIGPNCKVFVVGDLKQSIYRFRGAQLSAFNRVDEFENEKVEHKLTRNYRTDKRLLDLYHNIFDNMGNNKWLPYVDDDRLTGVRVFDTAEENLLKCIPVHRKDDEGFYDTLFKTVNHEVMNYKELLQTKQLSNEEKTIAILVRNNYNIDDIVREAKKRGVDVEINSGGDLYQVESTIDLYKLLSAMRNPDSAIHLIDFIESNYINGYFNYLVLKGKTNQEQVIILTQFLNQYFSNKVGRTWQDYINDVYNKPILYVIRKAFEELEPWVKACDSKYSQIRYVSNFECLIEDLLSTGRNDAQTLNSVSEYLRISIVTGQEKESRDISIKDNKTPRILCTTIHKSKGLEYGTVILPFTYDSLDNPNKEKLFASYTNSELAYYLSFNDAASYNTNYVRDNQLKEQVSEECRILYVALTRAIRNCIWFKNLDANTSISWGTLMEEE